MKTNFLYNNLNLVPQPEYRFNSFTRFFLSSPTGVLGLIGLSLLGLLLRNTYSSVTTLYELKSPEDSNDNKNREFNSFIFPLFHKYTNSGSIPRDVDFKLGKFVNRETVMSAIYDGTQQKKISDRTRISTLLYYTLLHVGNPGNTYYLDVDTGSDLTWIQCDAPCKRCAKGPNPLYKPSKGNILPPNNKLCLHVQSNHNQYADLSSSIGVLARDNLHLTVANGTLVKPNFVLGYVPQTYNQQGQLSFSPARTDGILGLSRASISLPSQLASQGVIQNVVGHCIASGAESDGYMFLGDEPVPRRGMTWVPMLNIPSIDLFHTEIVKLSYGGRQLSLDESGNNGGRVVFDSGSSYTYFPNKAYSDLIASLEDAFHEELVQDVSDPTLPLCWRAKYPIRSLEDVKALFKPLTFQFGSKWWILSSNLKIPPEGYLIISSKGNVCLGILDGSEVLDEPMILLGVVNGKMGKDTFVSFIPNIVDEISKLRTVF
ncbi:hypothetical protein MKX01_033878 [Papaver californicum]|nr:hypothetical protein MKX01_033878 [Papaver californicum]